ncbi:hypothetical protein [Sphingomonas sp. Leaf21]|uniref:hypothetical protein n=1 Tax=Sphingomonas sp. Leaf21 TaxID=2876550 RepID=UPI001E506EBC|nr:hypothetical protein [Sphingomonas sp. Leaf21]
MTLTELLAAKGVKSALIVDDVCDAVPTAGDIGAANEAWPIFNDDLTAEQRAQIAAEYPAAAQLDFDVLIDDDAYVAAVWSLRDALGEVATPLFGQYLADQAADQKFVDLAVEKLTGLGVTCVTSGRHFADAAQPVDLIVIDLFFNKAQDDAALGESKVRLRETIERRRANPPLVILMSRSPRLDQKRDEFRDEVGLLDSAFRILKKSDIEESDKLERQLARLAENATDSRKLARFFAALESGMAAATERTLSLFRNLKLSDVGQIQQLVLNAEGEPAGSYLVDVFDRVLQHEIEREAGIIDAALALNDFSAVSHPPPYVAGSAELQKLVERLLTQHGERLRLPGAVDAQVTFGDVLTTTNTTDLNRLRKIVPVDIAETTAMLVLTPVCDLQRNGAPRILLLIGEVKPLGATAWTYGEDARTPAIRLSGELAWIKWNLKHIDTISRAQLEEALGYSDLKVAARLREAHAIELQQRLLSGLGRVGLVAAMPATFPVDVEIYYAGTDDKPTGLEIPALADGAVCFVGRDDDSNSILRLVMTESGCDGVIDALANLAEETVAEKARKALGHIKTSGDLRKILTNGLDLKSARDDRWFQIQSLSGANDGVPKMGLLAWNFAVPDQALEKGDLNKAGVIILVKDRDQANVPGLNDAIRSGLVAAPVGTEPDSEDDLSSPTVANNH